MEEDAQFTFSLPAPTGGGGGSGPPPALSFGAGPSGQKKRKVQTAFTGDEALDSLVDEVREKVAQLESRPNVNVPLTSLFADYTRSLRQVLNSVNVGLDPQVLANFKASLTLFSNEVDQKLAAARRVPVWIYNFNVAFLRNPLLNLPGMTDDWGQATEAARREMLGRQGAAKDMLATFIPRYKTLASARREITLQATQKYSQYLWPFEVPPLLAYLSDQTTLNDEHNANAGVTFKPLTSSTDQELLSYTTFRLLDILKPWAEPPAS